MGNKIGTSPFFDLAYLERRVRTEYGIIRTPAYKKRNESKLLEQGQTVELLQHKPITNLMGNLKITENCEVLENHEICVIFLLVISFIVLT